MHGVTTKARGRVLYPRIPIKPSEGTTCVACRDFADRPDYQNELARGSGFHGVGHSACGVTMHYAEKKKGLCA